ncbi:MAG TPA: NAD(P)-dependent oxidoreductase [Thermoleophilaceae bacterium]|jgi:3-hydroxyisobutyrate dehydrogenase-like beta-hydroxyacid dehydrogenase
MSEIERVAFLGTGIMGSRMAANVVVGNFEVKLWNRTRAKAERVAELSGAGVADTPAEAAKGADAVITMVVDSPEVEAVLFGENGAAGVLEEGALVIDCSTIAPKAVTSIAERLGERGIHFVDAPVSGSSPKAEDATLTIMVGASDPDFERALPLLESMGELIVHCGPLGHGQMVKLLNNTLAGTNAAVLAEAIAVAEQAGLDMEALTKVVGASSGNSTMLALKAGPMIEHTYEPLFKLDHMLKDVRHCLNAANDLGVETPVSEAAKTLYEAASAMGKGDEDFAAVIEAVEPQ